jgi:apoptosis-inducing factor 3
MDDRDAGPESIVIIGGSAAGNAAAEMLRCEGYAGPVTMLSADDAPPYGRPNLSKDYLAGTAPEEWIPLLPPRVLCRPRDRAKARRPRWAIDAKAREVGSQTAAAGASSSWHARLCKTGDVLNFGA